MSEPDTSGTADEAPASPGSSEPLSPLSIAPLSMILPIAGSSVSVSSPAPVEDFSLPVSGLPEASATPLSSELFLPMPLPDFCKCISWPSYFISFVGIVN